jgi:tRNA(Phe) wybutosine-synthesizing methylase Tyw3
MSTEKVETIVAKDNKILISKEYLETLIEESNKKLIRCHNKFNLFQERLK